MPYVRSYLVAALSLGILLPLAAPCAGAATQDPAPPKKAKAKRKPMQLASATSPAYSPNEMVTAPLPALDPAAAAKKRFAADFGIQHYFSTRPELHPYTSFTLDLSYAFDQRNKVQAIGAADKLYDFAPPEQEFGFQDTRLYYHYGFMRDWHNLDGTLRLGVTLPTSKVSRDNGLIAAPSVRAKFSSKVFDSLTLAYAPSFRFNLNEYTTTVDGKPLKKGSLANTATAAYQITEDLSFTALGMLGYDFTEANASATQPGGTRGTYEIEGTLNYQINPHLAFGLDVDQSDAYMHEGRYEMVVYDPYNTRFSATVDITF